MLLRRRAGRVTLALALVGLVLAMHALTVTAAHSSTAPSATAGSGGHHGATAPMSEAMVPGHDPLTAGPVAGDPPSPPPGHAGAHGALALMCLAVLALTALLVLRPGSGRGWSSSAVVARRDRVGVVARSRGPAPPDLHQLSILRC